MNKEVCEALYYLKVVELKGLCIQLGLPFNGAKAEIIDRLRHFVATGAVLKPAVIPEISKAKKGLTYPLQPGTFMLQGAYKNDAKTRAFFKELIGNHFHFTAFGIDWLNERWQQGNPPTYQEFADMWQKETKKRKKQKPDPKKEWAYIAFVQQYGILHPKASKIETTNAWNKTRAEKVELVTAFFKTFKKKVS